MLRAQTTEFLLRRLTRFLHLHSSVTLLGGNFHYQPMQSDIPGHSVSLTTPSIVCSLVKFKK